MPPLPKAGMWFSSTPTALVSFRGRSYLLLPPLHYKPIGSMEKWYIYLHEWLIFYGFHVAKGYQSHGYYGLKKTTLSLKHDYIHPGRLTWNIVMEVFRSGENEGTCQGAANTKLFILQVIQNWPCDQLQVSFWASAQTSSCLLDQLWLAPVIYNISKLAI